MSKFMTFTLGAAFGTAVGVIGICWLISKCTAGITWYSEGGLTEHDE